MGMYALVAQYEDAILGVTRQDGSSRRSEARGDSEFQKDARVRHGVADHCQDIVFPRGRRIADPVDEPGS
jgi:hypothetical protein